MWSLGDGVCIGQGTGALEGGAGGFLGQFRAGLVLKNIGQILGWGLGFGQCNIGQLRSKDRSRPM